MTLLLAFSLLAPAHAAPATARDATGHVVSLDAGTLVVAWRLDDLASIEALRVAERAGAELGVPVLALNLDGVHERSRLVPYLVAQGCAAPTLTDPDGAWRHRLQVTPGALVVLGEAGAVAARIPAGPDTAGTRQALARALGRTLVAAKP
ncbi:MAG: hypothetical protein ACOZNI_34165 [Myxococcota bacterium]